MNFRPAVRENVGLWINLIGGTGGGKTFTGLRLASGISLDRPFAFIDAENRRGLHYADKFRFDYAQLKSPFRPEAYTDAIVSADSAGYPVIVVDSFSHVWAGDGGILDWQETILEERVERALKRQGEDRQDWQLRDAYKMAAWIDPKMSHKAMVNKLLQVKAHLIICLRAEQKVEIVREQDEKTKKIKTVIREKQSLTGKAGWIPVCDKNLPFEATCSFLLLASAPGLPQPIKLQEQHRSIFPLDQPITEESGRRLAAWASGAKETATAASALAAEGSPVTGEPSGAQTAATITEKQEGTILDLLEAHGLTIKSFLEFGELTGVAKLPAPLFDKACAWIKKNSKVPS